MSDKWLLRACPRCGGDLHRNGQPAYDCLQCARAWDLYLSPLSRLADSDITASTRYGDRLPYSHRMGGTQNQYKRKYTIKAKGF